MNRRACDGYTNLGKVNIAEISSPWRRSN